MAINWSNLKLRLSPYRPEMSFATNDDTPAVTRWVEIAGTGTYSTVTGADEDPITEAINSVAELLGSISAGGDWPAGNRGRLWLAAYRRSTANPSAWESTPYYARWLYPSMIRNDTVDGEMLSNYVLVSVTAFRELWVPDAELKIALQVRYDTAPGTSINTPVTLADTTLVSERYRVIYTGRKPSKPTITSPANNLEVLYDQGALSEVLMSWTSTSPDAQTETGWSADRQADYGGWQAQIRTQDGPSWTPWADYTMSVRAGDSGCGGPQSDSVTSWQRKGRQFTPANNTFCNTPFGAQGAVAQKKETYLMAMPSGSVTPIANNSWTALDPGVYQFRVRVFTRAVTRWVGSGTVPPADAAPPVAMSDWSDPVTLYVNAPFLPPIPISPANSEAISGDSIRFEWQFRDPREEGGSQAERAIRVRKAGEGDGAWVEIIDVGDQPGSDQFYEATNGDLYTFEPGIRYEWQAKTVSTPGDYESTWSNSAFFYYIPAPGSGQVMPTPSVTFPDTSLGCGRNRVFVFKRGGLIPLGELSGITQVTWERKRDDISQAVVTISLMDGRAKECEQVLANLRTWLHELVIFRDSGNGPHRVWEGPVTLIQYEADRVTVSARDVMVWPYRRILRLGYSDAYRITGRRYDDNGDLVDPGTVISQPRRVTIRSSQIIQNALAYDDPNVLAYMQINLYDDDAKESRSVQAYSRTSWQEVDDLAAKAGLDYTVVGRKIILWDTHRALGTLPEMRDGDFNTSPVVSEYGMQAANIYGVTNNNGVYGLAERTSMRDEYGYIEMLSSAYGEDDEAGSEVTLTDEARERLEETLEEQAERNIASRWPVPVVVRIPDNSTLSPDIGITINQLVPGVHIPLRSTSTLREVAQIQKLDSMKVTENEGGETVQVTMSPAPRSRDEDPDGGEGGGEE